MSVVNEVGGGGDLRLVVLAKVHGLPFPEVGIERDVLGELALKPINDPARGLALATDVAGAANEEAEGFHGEASGAEIAPQQRWKVNLGSQNRAGSFLRLHPVRVARSSFGGNLQPCGCVPYDAWE